jgi:hypothetical protein
MEDCDLQLKPSGEKSRLPSMHFGCCLTFEAVGDGLKNPNRQLHLLILSASMDLDYGVLFLYLHVIPSCHFEWHNVSSLGFQI